MFRAYIHVLILFVKTFVFTTQTFFLQTLITLLKFQYWIKMPNSMKDPLNEKQSETGTNDRLDSTRTTTTMMPETNWNSIYTASMLSFIGTVQFSLYFSSMWPYVQIVKIFHFSPIWPQNFPSLID